MKIAYLTNCFGTQSHTFIRREIVALRKLGVDIQLFGIRQDKVINEDVKNFVDETEYLYPLSIFHIIKANIISFYRSPIGYLKNAFSAFFSLEFSLARRAKMLYHYFVSASIGFKIRDANITHIHAHFMNVSASIAMYASQHSGIPFSITVHSAGTFKTPHILGINQKLRSAQALLMISHYNVKYFDAIYPCKSKSFVVRCGINIDDFTYQRAENYKPHSPLRVISVGRFVEKKGFIYLLQAAALLRDQDFSFLLTLIGDGPLFNELKKQVSELNLDKLVKFTGQQSTEYVRKTMQKSDVVVVPSLTSASGEKEGIPVVIIEAMATGIPVIASEHSGIPEIVINGLTGTLTPEKDPKAIANGIKNIALHAQQEQIAKAHQLIKETFNIEVVAKQRFDIFTQLQKYN